MTIEKVSPQVTEIVIDQLVDQFHKSVTNVAQHPEKYSQMLSLLQGLNPQFSPRRN